MVHIIFKREREREREREGERDYSTKRKFYKLDPILYLTLEKLWIPV